MFYCSLEVVKPDVHRMLKLVISITMLEPQIIHMTLDMIVWLEDHFRTYGLKHNRLHLVVITTNCWINDKFELYQLWLQNQL